MVKTPQSQCWGHGFNPWLAKLQHEPWHIPLPQKKREKDFIYMNILIACWLIVLDLFLKVFPPPPFFYLLWFDIYFSWCVWLLFHFLCVSILDFWFVVPMRFWFSLLYMYKINLLICWFQMYFLFFICTLPFASYFFMEDFLHCFYVCLHQWASPFLNLFILIVSSFLHREVPLGFFL